MTPKEINCQKTCRNSCSMLNEAMQVETAAVRFYEAVFDQCTIPEVRKFIAEIIDQKRSVILGIIQKLNEIHARSITMDGIISSYQAS